MQVEYTGATMRVAMPGRVGWCLCKNRGKGGSRGAAIPPGIDHFIMAIRSGWRPGVTAGISRYRTWSASGKVETLRRIGARIT